MMILMLMLRMHHSDPIDYYHMALRAAYFFLVDFLLLLGPFLFSPGSNRKKMSTPKLAIKVCYLFCCCCCLIKVLFVLIHHH